MTRWAAIVVGAWALAAAPAGAAPGDLDPSFGQGGVALIADAAFGARGAAATPDGGIVVVGNGWTVAKLTATGALDRTFGVSGIATAPLPAPQTLHLSTSVLVQDDGGIVVGGQVDPVWDNDGSARFALARFLPDGQPDPAFGSGGMVIMPVRAGEQDSVVAALAPAPGGRIIACGSSDERQGPGAMALARFDSSGHLDPTFAGGGLTLGPAGFCLNVARGAGSTLLAAGQGRDGSGFPTLMAARFRGDGTPDPTFGAGGVATTGLSLLSAPCFRDVVGQPDGKVVLTGDGQDGFRLARLDTLGRLDPTFGSGGVVEVANLGLSCPHAALQANGRLVLVGNQLVPSSDHRFAIARYQPNGSLDPSFNGGFVFELPPGTERVTAGSMLLAPDGKIVAVGLAGDSQGRSYLAAVRLMGDGPAGAPASLDSGPALGAAASQSAPSRTARFQAALRSLRRALQTRRARRALRHGGLTLRVAVPADNRLTLALPRRRTPPRLVARGTSHGTTLRLHTTRTGKRLLRHRAALRLRARVRLLAGHGETLSATLDVTLPTAR